MIRMRGDFENIHNLVKFEVYCLVMQLAAILLKLFFFEGFLSSELK